ncbi:hypothetical protein WJ66_00503, partial [Stenotrophomonas maltophilia WJ66]
MSTEAENQSMPTVRVPSAFLNSLTPLLDAGSPDPATTARSPTTERLLLFGEARSAQQI